ncbi:MAG: hypothetical protein WD851_23545 [Pirellulales bacterium]
MFWKLHPEVAIEIEEGTIMDPSVHPPIVEKLSVRFEGWLGDDLLETFPCFLVTDRLRHAIEATGFTGCSFDEVEVSKSEEFDEMYPGRELPRFWWMKIPGMAAKDDFGISTDHCLVVSQRVFDLIMSFQLDNCDAEEFGDLTPPVR